MRLKIPEEQAAMDSQSENANGSGKGDHMTGIKLIDKYTNYYYRQMKNDGWNVEHGVIMSELGLVYAKALDRKSNGGFKDQGDGNEATASFETYCARGFENQICTLKRQLIEEREIAKVTVRFDDEVMWDEDGVMADDAYMAKESEAKILGLFSGLRQAIAGELICPSQAIVERIKHYNDACRIPENLLKHRTPGSLPKAIAEVYDITERKAYYEIDKIKKSIKKLLTS